MKRNKTAKRWLRKRQRAVKGGLAKLVSVGKSVLPEQPAPVSETPTATNLPSESGILRQDHSHFRLPNALAEAGELERPGWMPNRIVIFVVVFALIFIGIIAWQVSEMPAPK
jgi:hypothetical protein